MNALQLWEAEVRAGVDGQVRSAPSTWRLDALHAAACCEQTAREYDHDCPAVARGWREKADRLLTEGWV